MHLPDISTKKFSQGVDAIISLGITKIKPKKKKEVIVGSLYNLKKYSQNKKSHCWHYLYISPNDW